MGIKQALAQDEFKMLLTLIIFFAGISLIIAGVLLGSEAMTTVGISDSSAIVAYYFSKESKKE
jgi:hypothetical protein